MSNSISQKQMDIVLGHVIVNNLDDVRELLKRNGFKDVYSLDDNDVKIAFLKGIKDSPGFRADVADYLTGMIQYEGGQQTNFVNQPDGFLNVVSYADSMSADTGSAGSGTTSTTTTTPTTTTPKTSLFGSLLSSQNLNSILNAGLDVVSTKLKADSLSKTEQLALQQKQLELQIAQTNALSNPAAAKSSGMAWWGWLLIILGVGGLITFIVIKSKKK